MKEENTYKKEIKQCHRCGARLSVKNKPYYTMPDNKIVGCQQCLRLHN